MKKVSLKQNVENKFSTNYFFFQQKLMFSLKIFPMKSLELKISFSIESYDGKTDENYHYCYVPEKHIVLKISKLSMSNVASTYGRLE